MVKRLRGVNRLGQCVYCKKEAEEIHDLPYDGKGYCCGKCLSEKWQEYADEQKLLGAMIFMTDE